MGVPSRRKEKNSDFSQQGVMNNPPQTTPPSPASINITMQGFVFIFKNPEYSIMILYAIYRSIGFLGA